MFFLLLILFSLLLIAVITFYFHALSHTHYWHRHGIPGPRGQPLLGNLNDIHGRKLGIFQLREWTQRFGPVYGIQQGWTNILVCSDVQMLQELFLKKFEHFHGRKTNPMIGNVDTNPQIGMFLARGQRWKRLRAIATPAFSVNNLKKVLPILSDSSCKMMDFMQTEHPFNIHPHFHELTMDVISRVAMGQRESLQFQTENTKQAKRVMERIGNNPFDYYTWMFPRLWWFIRMFAFGTAALGLRDETFLAIMRRIKTAVDERKRQKEKAEEDPSKPVDFIDLFLEAESSVDEELDQQNNGAYSGGGDKVFNRAEAKVLRRLTSAEIVSQCNLFLLAGFDTTANTLAITCWYLAWHPQVQEKLQEEIDAVCGQMDEQEEPLTYEQLNQLKYSEAVMREALRLQPIAANVIDRLCAETTTLGDYIVEKGTVVKPDLLTIHMDKKIWGEDAEEFRPERWFEPNSRPPMAWLPFGAGPRICVGMKLAQLEQKLALAHLLSKYSVKPCSETEKQLKIVGQGIFNPESVTIQLELRNKQMKQIDVEKQR